MQTHLLLAKRITAVLGEPERRDDSYKWRVNVGAHGVSVFLRLPGQKATERVWIFDPRRKGNDSARRFIVETPEDIDAVMAEVAAIAHAIADSRSP